MGILYQWNVFFFLLWQCACFVVALLWLFHEEGGSFDGRSRI